MGFTSKGSSSEGWGMGFFLVFFHDEDHHQEPNNNNNNNIIAKKKSSNFNFFSSSLSLPSSLKRTNSTHLLYKAQSTISICALLLFTTLLLFTISTLPSTTNAAAAAAAARGGHMYNNPRRQLSFKAKEISSSSSLNSSYALQGMGTLYRRGTRAMSGLIVAHAVESLTLHEFKLFLRLLYRSSITSRSDLLFLFPSKSAAFGSTIQEENDSFLRLLNQYNMQHSSINRSSFSSFDHTQFVKKSNKQKENGEPIWGRRIRSNYSEEGETEPTRLSYGSVVAFDVDELDPENSLSGFLDHVPMSLRRWACYPMLLGRVRRNFKHVTMVDIKEILLLDDPFDKVRTATLESVFVKSSVQSNTNKHGRKNSDKTHDLTHQKPVNPAIISGGARGIRRLSNSMLTEIVRAAMVKRKKNLMTESTLFNQLVRNQFILKNVNLMVSTESIPELSSLIGSISNSGSSLSNSKYALVRRGNTSLDVHSILMRHICSFPIDSTVYSDC